MDVQIHSMIVENPILLSLLTIETYGKQQTWEFYFKSNFDIIDKEMQNISRWNLNSCCMPGTIIDADLSV